MSSVVVPLVETYLSLFPGPMRASRRALYADMAWRCGGRRVDHRLLGKWRRREVAIPDDAREAMAAAVIEAWSGEFDRAGLVRALSVYPQESPKNA